jgi:hypothetical protein
MAEKIPIIARLKICDIISGGYYICTNNTFVHLLIAIHLAIVIANGMKIV